MTTLLTKVSSTADAVPIVGNLTQTASGAELAVNTTDKKLYSKNSSNAVVEIAGALHAYPVGAVYISVVATSPATLFGGTWAVFGAGRALVSLDSSDTDFDTAEEERGAKTHTLTTNEIPAHTHNVAYDNELNLEKQSSGGHTISELDGTSLTRATTSTGGGQAHNNIQPSIVVYMWKRTA
tara:strand:+ start:144 stop:686 length:543 start_codon:yes stop_codon:yes gene_type:complete